MWFTQRDVRRQLAAMGYLDVPDDILAAFTQDLARLALEEEEGAPQPAQPTSPARPQRPGHSLRSSATTTAWQALSGSRTSGGDTSVLDMFAQLDDMGHAEEAAERERWQPTDADLLAELTDTDPHMPPPEEDAYGHHPVPLLPRVEDSAQQAARLSVVPPRQPVKQRKTDVVARGAQYRQAWSKRKVPGETQRTGLRWQVREQLRQDEEKYRARSAKPLQQNNYQVPTMKKRQDLRWNVRVHLSNLN